MKFRTEAKGNSATFDGTVRYGNYRATLETSFGDQRKLVDFLCSTYGTKNGYGELPFDLVQRSRSSYLDLRYTRPGPRDGSQPERGEPTRDAFRSTGRVCRFIHDRLRF
ncbi:hypothetical protein WME79_33745 [Sorangium sp. So ce726]|uniref:hypothetical protein n=1 Tax=Sorangium sp. So ce726 TaxID=3133319 RepID=UPI003F6389AA